MNNQKIENVLNLSLDVSVQEREKSEVLLEGYNTTEHTWELIVKHTKSLEPIREEIDGISSIVELAGGYAIVTIAERSIDAFAAYEEVENIEKPKRLYFAVDTGRTASCIDNLQSVNSRNVPVITGLTGQGVLFACIDSGIDYLHPDFINEDGSSRILYLWDQTATGGTPPLGYASGREYTKEQIDEALKASNRTESLAIVPLQDTGSGHGTAVTGIAAGNGRASVGRRYRGVAPSCSLIVVKLGNPGNVGFPRTTELMQAVDYVQKKSVELSMPLVINLSYGNNYGSHDGSSLLESFLNQIADRWKTSIVIGSGNEGDSGHHTAGVLQDAEQIQEFIVGSAVGSLSLQIWKQYYDEMDIYLQSPDGNEVFINTGYRYASSYVLQQTQILVYSGEPTPYSMNQEIFVEMLPLGDGIRIESGVWKVRLVPRKIRDGQYDMWLPQSALIGEESRFLQPQPEVTLTIPSVAAKAITVAAYNQIRFIPAAFSGRGFAVNGLIKPDIAAPGEQIMTAAPGGGYARRTGTSMAAPFVSGAAALLMEWGIVQGHSPYLYGEKLKAYLISGAKPLPGIEKYPDTRLGWGVLCVQDSFPQGFRIL